MRNLVWIPVLLSLLAAGCKQDRGDATLSEPQVDAATTPNDFLKFLNSSLYVLNMVDHDKIVTAVPVRNINSEAYADAYYGAVDPGGRRDTLAKWKEETGFDLGVYAHATFRDAKDLGYGRDMYARTGTLNTSGCNVIAVYVDNYVVELEPGDATSYGPLNLDAAVNQVQKYHFGSNAIEFSPEDETDCGSPRIAKFFTFGPRDGDGEQHRLTSADLDGRGVKYMPTMCLVCHGGAMYPLKDDSSFDPISLKSPKLHILEEDSFEFSALAGFREDDQQDAIKKINRLVYEAFQEMGGRADSNTDQANWDSSFAEELVAGAYTDINADDPPPNNPPADPYNAQVPSGWIQNVSRPDGVETLYRQVIEPHCIGCHSLRGTQVAERNNDANAVDFSSYEQFAKYNDLIIDYVYRRGSMPRSLINYTQFWKDPEGAPTLLATYLTGFDVLNADGKVTAPGRPVAIPGADRQVASPAVLGAGASLFTTNYLWSIFSSTDPGATLDPVTSPAPTLTAADGAVVVAELTTSNVRGTSEPAQVTITINNAIPALPTFDGDIKVILGGCAAACHSPSPDNDPTVDPLTGIPVYYDDTDSSDLYRRVLARVDRNDPENSLLLRRPTSSEIHGGGPIVQLDPTSTDFSTILQWIRTGANP